VYEQKNMTDSAKYFAGLSMNLLQEKNDYFSLSSNYELLSRLEERNSNYSKALNYLHEYNRYIMQINTRKEQFNIDEIEKNHNLKLLNESRDRIQSYKITVTVMAILIFVTVIFSCIRNRKLMLENRKLRQSLSEFENKSNSLLAENEYLTNMIVKFYKGACKFVSNVEINPTELNKFTLNAIIFPKGGRWETINYMFKVLFEKIQKQTSKYEITEFDLQIICLTCIGFDPVGISLILKAKLNTVRQNQSNLRKKLKMDTRAADIKDFILNLIKNIP
jgi:DNA-binding CsgD family transcriptional regulator